MQNPGNRLLATIALIIAICGWSGGAYATLIEGQINFGGSSFTFDGSTLTLHNPTIVGTSGDFVGETSVVINPLQYAPSTAMTSFWSTDNFTFDVLSTAILGEVAGSFLVLEGTGAIESSIAGFERTIGMWSFSGATGALNWSSATTSVSVPEPGSLGLLGAGLLGIGFFARKKQAS